MVLVSAATASDLAARVLSSDDFFSFCLSQDAFDADVSTLVAVLSSDMDDEVWHLFVLVGLFEETADLCKEGKESLFLRISVCVVSTLTLVKFSDFF